MALIRWEPAREIRTARGDVDRLFTSVFDTSTFARPGIARAITRGFSPALDILEGEDAFLIRADLPGLAEEDISLQVEDNLLTISGERKEQRAVKQGDYAHIERSLGAFRRSLSLPEGADADAVTASFRHGVLEIRVPKPEQRQPRRITIGVNGPETITSAPADTPDAEAPALAG